jgi:hypothetical protein
MSKTFTVIRKEETECTFRWGEEFIAGCPIVDADSAQETFNYFESIDSSLLQTSQSLSITSGKKE